MMISSGSYSATASIVAVYGSGSPTSPMASMPSSRRYGAREVDAHLRGVEHGVVVDDVAVARTRPRHADRRRGSRSSAACSLTALAAAARRRSSRWRRRGSSSRVSSSLARAGASFGRRRRARGLRHLRAALEDAVHRAGHAVLVRPADDRRDGVEVEDRRRRGDLPLERERAPRVGVRARARRATTRSCCRRRRACSGRG